ncbi:MAG TPA: glycosyltransferase family 1 protein, partial [Actinomycetota bacterium]|nr:glycosyltransferase family 1 protein [Actinomycetota bacterium]
MRIAVLHPQTAFTRGGAELHTEALVRALRESGHEAEEVVIAGKWYPATELAHQMAVWRSFDISESNGMKIDAAIALKFPAYLAPHERKIVWLIHQHRSAYE